MMISKAREASASSPAKAQRKRPPSPPKTAAKSHQPLHNFSLPPLLRWGSKRTVRSDKADPDDPEFTLRSYTPFSDHRSADHRRAFRHPSTPSSSSLFPSKPPPPPRSAADVAVAGGGKHCPADRGIEEIREKLLVHLHTAAKKMKFRLPEDGASADAGASAAAAGGGEVEESSSRPWNLRKRRAACRAPDDDSGRRDFPSSSPPPPPPESSLKSSRLRSMAAERGGGEKKERRKLSLSLSKDEIEEDIFLMTGSRPARRPKKRARNVQKQVDASPHNPLFFYDSSFLLRQRLCRRRRFL